MPKSEFLRRTLCIGVAIGTLGLFGTLSAFAAQPQTKAAAPTKTAAALMGDPVRGQSLYRICSGCHSIDENDVGPLHRGVVGRKAGGVATYSYSKALKDSHITWTPATLDMWLSDPQKLVRGSKMYFKVLQPKDRADIIAYLATQK
jgi:cytochrome c